MSTTPTMPDAGTAIDEMTIEQIRAELAGYQPATQSAVEQSAEHLARRGRLWARLDQLTKSGAASQPERQVR